MPWIGGRKFAVESVLRQSTHGYGCASWMHHPVGAYQGRQRLEFCVALSTVHLLEALKSNLMSWSYQIDISRGNFCSTKPVRSSRALQALQHVSDRFRHIKPGVEDLILLGIRFQRKR